MRVSASGTDGGLVAYKGTLLASGGGAGGQIVAHLGACRVVGCQALELSCPKPNFATLNQFEDFCCLCLVAGTETKAKLFWDWKQEIGRGEGCRGRNSPEELSRTCFDNDGSGQNRRTLP